MAADAAAWEVVDAFFAAAGRGDLAGLLAVLAPEVELRTHGPEGTVVVRGAGEVTARARTGARPGALARPVLGDGLPGVLIPAGGAPGPAPGLRIDPLRPHPAPRPSDPAPPLPAVSPR